MNKFVKVRFLKFSIFFATIIAGISIILYSLSDNISYYITPTKLLEMKIYDEIKLGGFVKENSIRQSHGDLIIFEVKDEENEILVKYQGIAPLIFRDNQGVILNGKLDKRGFFLAKKLLAKHDENYMPKIKK